MLILDMLNLLCLSFTVINIHPVEEPIRTQVWIVMSDVQFDQLSKVSSFNTEYIFLQ